MEKVEELNIFQVKKYDDIFYIVDQIKGYRVWILVKWKVTLNNNDCPFNMFNM